jgi:hypothetical protein
MLIPNIFLFQFANIAKGFEKAMEKLITSKIIRNGILNLTILLVVPFHFNKKT